MTAAAPRHSTKSARPAVAKHEHTDVTASPPPPVCVCVVHEAIHLTCFPKTAFSTKRRGRICLVCVCVYTPIPLTAFISSCGVTLGGQRGVCMTPPILAEPPVSTSSPLFASRLNPSAAVFLEV